MAKVFSTRSYIVTQTHETQKIWVSYLEIAWGWQLWRLWQLWQLWQLWRAWHLAFWVDGCWRFCFCHGMRVCHWLWQWQGWRQRCSVWLLRRNWWCNERLNAIKCERKVECDKVRTKGWMRRLVGEEVERKAWVRVVAEAVEPAIELLPNMWARFSSVIFLFMASTWSK